MQVIYTGNAMGRVGAELAVETNPDYHQFGWLFARNLDGQWVTVADLKPICITLVAAQAAKLW